MKRPSNIAKRDALETSPEAHPQSASDAALTAADLADASGGLTGLEVLGAVAVVSAVAGINYKLGRRDERRAAQEASGGACAAR